MLAKITFLSTVAVVVCTGSVNADIVPIGEFTGTHTDTFDQFNTVMAVQSLPVFGGLGALQNLDKGGAIKVEFSSSLNGDLVVPISGMMSGQLGVAQWVFDTPVTRFGGWWENNSGQDDATLEFFDANDNFIGTAIADVPVNAQMWTWNGWQSDVPIARIVVTGNGLVNGFIWYENMQVTVIPAPGVMGLMAIAFLGASGRARRRRIG